MTLRIESRIEADLEDLAYALRLSKTAAIRRILAQQSQPRAKSGRIVIFNFREVANDLP